MDPQKQSEIEAMCNGVFEAEDGEEVVLELCLPSSEMSKVNRYLRGCNIGYDLCRTQEKMLVLTLKKEDALKFIRKGYIRGRETEEHYPFLLDSVKVLEAGPMESKTPAGTVVEEIAGSAPVPVGRIYSAKKP